MGWRAIFRCCLYKAADFAFGNRTCSEKEKRCGAGLTAGALVGVGAAPAPAFAGVTCAPPCAIGIGIGSALATPVPVPDERGVGSALISPGSVAQDVKGGDEAPSATVVGVTERGRVDDSFLILSSTLFFGDGRRRVDESTFCFFVGDGRCARSSVSVSCCCFGDGFFGDGSSSATASSLASADFSWTNCALRSLSLAHHLSANSCFTSYAM